MDERVCPAHSGHEAILKQLCTYQGKCDTRFKDVHGRIDTLQKEKAPMKLFYVLITVLCLIFAGTFSLLWKGVENQATMAAQIDGIQYQLE